MGGATYGPARACGDGGAAGRGVPGCGGAGTDPRAGGAGDGEGPQGGPLRDEGGGQDSRRPHQEAGG
eukprot:1176390-Prorocentrum_minimum.AAC.1